MSVASFTHPPSGSSGHFCLVFVPSICGSRDVVVVVVVVVTMLSSSVWGGLENFGRGKKAWYVCGVA